MNLVTRQPLPRAYAATAFVFAVATLGLAARHALEPSGPALSPADVRLRIDPNRASAAELELLPRIGPTIAAAIIEKRERATSQPAFRSLADLDAVRGIGPVTLEQIAPHLVFPTDHQ